MAPRAFWTGNLRLSLVVLPVRLYPATGSARKIGFHKIYEPTGERVHYQDVTESEGPVDKDKIVKGYEYQRGRHVTLADEELERVRLESTRTIDLVQFVESRAVDPLYFDKPYFLAPEGKAAAEAYGVIRDVLAETDKMAIGQVVFRRREHVAAIRPHGRGMLLETLRYQYQVRAADKYFGEIKRHKADKETVELARHLVETRTRAFDPDKFHDHYEEALRELVAAKLKHKKLPELPKQPAKSNVIDLMGALKASLKERRKPRAKAPAKRRRKAAARRKAA